MLLDDRLMADVACLDPVYVDGVLGLVSLGTTFMECFFRWAPVRSEGGVVIREKVASHVIIRPTTSIRPGGYFSRVLSVQGDPALAHLVRPELVAH